MANKTKQRATDAINRLSHYLRRDAGGKQMAEDISRYVGELRHQLASLKTSLESKATEVETLKQTVATMSSDSAQMQREVDDLRKANTQLSSQVSLLEEQNERLNQSLNCDFLPEMREYRYMPRKASLLETQRKLREDIPKLPPPKRPSSEDAKYWDRIYTFELGDVMSSMRTPSFATLGRLALWSAVCGFGFSVWSKETMRDWTKFTDKQGRRWMQYIKPWIDIGPAWQERLRMQMYDLHPYKNVRGELVRDD